MPNRILKSTLTAAGIDHEKFPAIVDGYLAEKSAHADHMKRVEADKALPELVAPNFKDFDGNGEKFTAAAQEHERAVAARHQAYPAPHAHPLIAAVLSGDGQYEVYNDDAEVAEAQLAQAKADLVHRVLSDETAAIEKISPTTRHRALQYREHDITKKGKENWTEEDRRFLEDQASARDQIDEIQRRAAGLLAEIDGLTSETIIDWTKKVLEEKVTQ